MDYAAHYDRLVGRAKNRRASGYVERHHIIPRCLGGTDDPANIVPLTAEEHFVAHQLLVRIYPEHPQLIWAAHLMATRPGNKLYGWMRRRMAEARRGRKQSAEHVAKLSAIRKGRAPARHAIERSAEKRRGKRLSPETIARMRVAAKVRGVSPKTRAALAAYHANRRALREA